MGVMPGSRDGEIGRDAGTGGLADLVVLLGSSFPMYLGDAGIWTYPGREEIKLSLADLAGDIGNVRDRASVALESVGRMVPRAEYPLRFAATHDLDLRYLLPRVIDSVRDIAAGCERILASLGGSVADDAASTSGGRESELIREARATALGHLDVLEQLLSADRGPAPVISREGGSPAKSG